MIQVSPASQHYAAAKPNPQLCKGSRWCLPHHSGCWWQEGLLPTCPTVVPFLHQAFSAFFYTVDFIQTVMGRPVHLPSDLKDAAEMICATSWSEVGSLGMVGWRGLLHVGHHSGTESSP